MFAQGYGANYLNIGRPITMVFCFGNMNLILLIRSDQPYLFMDKARRQINMDITADLSWNLNQIATG